MLLEEWDKENHDYLMKFLQETKGDTGDITGSMKTIIVQFISSVKRTLSRLGAQQNGIVSKEQIIGAQIDELRQCVIDLQHILNSPQTKETLQ